MVIEGLRDAHEELQKPRSDGIFLKARQGPHIDMTAANALYDANHKPRCPEARYLGDPPPRCNLTNLKGCIREDGHECEYYNDFLKENTNAGS